MYGRLAASQQCGFLYVEEPMLDPSQPLGALLDFYRKSTLRPVSDAHLNRSASSAVRLEPRGRAPVLFLRAGRPRRLQWRGQSRHESSLSSLVDGVLGVSEVSVGLHWFTLPYEKTAPELNAV